MIATSTKQIAFTILIWNFQVLTYTYLISNSIHSGSYQMCSEIQT